MQPPRVALHPCCALDIIEPFTILQPYADEIIFCDRSADGHQLAQDHADKIPKPIYVHEDFRKFAATIDQFDVLFYRRDSNGEGGSGLYILGDEWLRQLVPKFNPSGGFVITDGSNNRGNAYRKMRQQSGLRRFGRHIKPLADQFLKESHNLLIFEVLPA